MPAPTLVPVAAETIALANQHCQACFGIGMRARGVPCACVTRSIFRICLERYQACRFRQGVVGGVSLEKIDCGTRSFRCYGRRDEEYIADFELSARRVLSAGERRVFDLYYLDGGDWRGCSQVLRMDKGTFFHAAYRVAHLVGRACRETQPHALFPLREYFRA